MDTRWLIKDLADACDYQAEAAVDWKADIFTVAAVAGQFDPYKE